MISRHSRRRRERAAALPYRWPATCSSSPPDHHRSGCD